MNIHELHKHCQDYETRTNPMSPIDRRPVYVETPDGHYRLMGVQIHEGFVVLTYDEYESL